MSQEEDNQDQEYNRYIPYREESAPLRDTISSGDKRKRAKI
jgi:hypothetical protein